jgi:quercetin dioxygenase-like cupin family protein
MDSPVAKNKIGPRDGERADFPALGNRFVVRSEDTGGRFALIEHTVPPRALAAPTHVHENEDEYSFVLSGEIGVQLGNEVLTAGPGELVFKPRGVPHAFWNAGDEEARLLELISPGGFPSSTPASATSRVSGRSRPSTASRWTSTRSGG